MATRFTDTASYLSRNLRVCRLLKAHDLITSPDFVVIKAVEEFKDKTTASNQLWQTDFTYLKVIGWGWFYLSTILDDFSDTSSQTFVVAVVIVVIDVYFGRGQTILFQRERIKRETIKQRRLQHQSKAA